MIIRLATLDDYEQAKHIRQEAAEVGNVFKDKSLFDNYYARSICQPDRFGIFLAFTEEVVGLASVVVHLQDDGLQVRRDTFLSGVYLRKGIPFSLGKMLSVHINQWAVQRNCYQIFGNFWPKGKIDAYKRKYGLEVSHLVVTRGVDYGRIL